MARREHAKWALIKASNLVGGQTENKGNQRQNKWRQQWANKNETKDPSAMDVDTVQLKPLTNKEQKTLSKEGRCFHCQQIRHMS